MNLSYKLSPLYLCSALLFCAPPNVYSQEVPVCLSVASDSDGDGWGWENNGSCRVTLDVSTCIDSDGDGWGWDGVASCLVTETAEIAGAVDTETTQCVDTDGDGYGWDGSDTCIVEQVAGVPTENLEAVSKPYMNRYETSTTPSYWQTSPVFSYVTDALPYPITSGWIEEEVNAPLGYARLYMSSIVLCEDPDITLEDPSNLGMFFDASLGQSCAKDNNISIPAPDLVEFTKIGVEVLYENGNQWSCVEETRPSMDTEFEANGTTGSMNFSFSDGVRITIGNEFQSYGAWAIDGTQFFLGDIKGAKVFRANVSYADGALTFYRSGLTRLSCDRTIEPNYPFTLYGEDKAELYRAMWNAFIGDNTPKTMLLQPYALVPIPLAESDLTKLRGDQLDRRTMRCDLLFSGNAFAGSIYESFSQGEIETTIEALGGDEYDFSIDGTENLWSQVSDVEFYNRDSIGSMSFFRYTDDMSLRYVRLGGPSVSLTVHACETIAVKSE